MIEGISKKSLLWCLSEKALAPLFKNRYQVFKINKDEIIVVEKDEKTTNTVLKVIYISFFLFPILFSFAFRSIYRKWYNIKVYKHYFKWNFKAFEKLIKIKKDFNNAYQNEFKNAVLKFRNLIKNDNESFKKEDLKKLKKFLKDQESYFENIEEIQKIVFRATSSFLKNKISLQLASSFYKELIDFYKKYSDKDFSSSNRYHMFCCVVRDERSIGFNENLLWMLLIFKRHLILVERELEIKKEIKWFLKKEELIEKLTNELTNQIKIEMEDKERNIKTIIQKLLEDVLKEKLKKGMLKFLINYYVEGKHNRKIIKEQLVNNNYLINLLKGLKEELDGFRKDDKKLTEFNNDQLVDKIYKTLSQNFFHGTKAFAITDYCEHEGGSFKSLKTVMENNKFFPMVGTMDQGAGFKGINRSGNISGYPLRMADLSISQYAKRNSFNGKIFDVEKAKVSKYAWDFEKPEFIDINERNSYCHLFSRWQYPTDWVRINRIKRYDKEFFEDRKSEIIEKINDQMKNFQKLLIKEKIKNSNHCLDVLRVIDNVEKVHEALNNESLEELKDFQKEMLKEDISLLISSKRVGIPCRYGEDVDCEIKFPGDLKLGKDIEIVYTDKTNIGYVQKLLRRYDLNEKVKIFSYEILKKANEFEKYYFLKFSNDEFFSSLKKEKVI
jgi:hypothetical protein